MTNVPPEYLSNDYGFTAVDEIDIPQSTQESQTEVEALNLQRYMETKFDDLAAKLDAISYSINHNTNEHSAVLSEAEYKDKIKRLEAIIVPLFNNLLKTADKAYIYWPDRRNIIQAQMDAVLAITRG